MAEHPIKSQHSEVTEPEYGTGKKSLSVYFSGFFACLLLTFVPFLAVLEHRILKSELFFIIFITAIMQFFVQVICFLRLNAKTTQGKVNILSFFFTIIVLFILVGGSAWIMFHVNYNMTH